MSDNIFLEFILPSTGFESYWGRSQIYLWLGQSTWSLTWVIDYARTAYTLAFSTIWLHMGKNPNRSMLSQCFLCDVIQHSIIGINWNRFVLGGLTRMISISWRFNVLSELLDLLLIVLVLIRLLALLNFFVFNCCSLNLWNVKVLPWGTNTCWGYLTLQFID